MPLYEFQCPRCGVLLEKHLPLPRCNETVDCESCFLEDELIVHMEKIFSKLTTLWKDSERKWGTSLYRSHDKGKEVKKSRFPEFIPRKGGGEKPCQ